MHMYSGASFLVCWTCVFSAGLQGTFTLCNVQVLCRAASMESGLLSAEAGCAVLGHGPLHLQSALGSRD